MNPTKLRSRQGDQPLPQPGITEVAESVIAHVRSHAEIGHHPAAAYSGVCDDIEQRIKLGVQRYGTRLQTHNGRDALIDCYEELLDAANYARQEMLEHPSGKASLRFWVVIGVALDTKAALLERDNIQVNDDPTT